MIDHGEPSPFRQIPICVSAKLIEGTEIKISRMLPFDASKEDQERHEAELKGHLSSLVDHYSHRVLSG